MLTNEQITKLASRKGVKRIAVENFLSTLDDMTYQEARANMEVDARSYGWSRETQAAIAEGLLKHFLSR